MDCDYAYAAGLVDGEGSILLESYVTRAGNQGNRFVVVSVPSTSYELVAWLKDKFDGSVTIRRKKQKEHYLQSYVWRIVRNAALYFLRKILPYLLVEEKRRRATLLVVRYPQLIHPAGKYSGEMLQKREDFEKLFFKHVRQPRRLHLGLSKVVIT